MGIKEGGLMYTLCFILTPARILLGQKKRGFGVGLWNGFGGKVQGSETLEQCVRREALEEVGLTIEVQPAGFIKVKSLEVALFTSRTFKGLPIETEEMRPQWFMRAKLPWSEMWDTDKLWLPGLLNKRWVDMRIV